jgi:hypothetical protein
MTLEAALLIVIILVGIVLTLKRLDTQSRRCASLS